MGYIVALRYTSKAGGYAGVVTWTSFNSKAKLDKWLSSQDEQEVVEEGISDKRAMELSLATPIRCRLMAAVEDSCDKKKGDVFPDLLISNIQQILTMERIGLGA